MNRSNIAIALLCLFLGAALAEWLASGDANAQALPPSSGGGTSYTHPSAISLSNGIDSQDGGTIVGRLKVAPVASSAHSAVSASVYAEAQPEATTALLVQGKAGVGNSISAWAATSAASYVGLLSFDVGMAGCWGMTRSGGYGDSLYFCPYRGSGDTMAILAGHASSTAYGLRIQSYNGSSMETAFETVGGWPAVPKVGAGAPAGTACDAAAEVGRVYYDTTNHFQYFCEGAAGWYKSGVYAP